MEARSPTPSVAGYVESSVERRGKNARAGGVWSMLELQELLDEWLVAVWQKQAP